MREKQSLSRRAPGSRFLSPGGNASPAAAPTKEGVVASTFHDHDRAYFQAYSHVGIHEEMIKVKFSHLELLSAVSRILVFVKCRECLKLFE